MMNIKVFENIIDKDIQKEMKGTDWCDLFSYACHTCKIDGLIAAAHLFCPRIIQVKDYIFIEQFWNGDTKEKSEKCISDLEERFGNDRKSIEMMVNSCSIGDFFLGDTREVMNNEKVLFQFGNALVYFWKQRVDELFPERNIVVELGHELMGEFGLTITMYQRN